MSFRRFPLLVFFLSALLFPVKADFSTSSLLLLRVGNGVSCPSATLACAWTTANAFIDEVDLNGTMIRSIALPTTFSFGSTDPNANTLSRCGDGSCVTFNGLSTVAGTTSTALLRFQNIPRTIIRISYNEVIDNSTNIPFASYSTGLIKGVCSLDGSGYWIAGNSTTEGIVYVPHGNGNIVNRTYYNNAQLQVGKFTGCTAVTEPSNALYFARAHANFGFIDAPVPQTQTLTNENILVSGTSAGAWSPISSSWYFKQVLTGVLQDRFWALDPYTNCIYFNFGPSAANGAMGLLYALPKTEGILSGMALNPDETRLYLITQAKLMWIPATPIVVGNNAIVHTVMMTSSAPFMEFRSLALPPFSCAKGIPGYFCNGGAFLRPCRAGTIGGVNTSGTVSIPSSCSQCPAGTYSGPIASTCINCLPGFACPAGSSSTSVVCPAEYYCQAGAAPALCPAGRLCLAGTSSISSDDTLCPLGFYCPGNAAGKLACAAGNWCPRGSTADNSVPCATGWACQEERFGGTVPCPSGTYSATTGLISSSSCIACPAGVLCDSSLVTGGMTNITTTCPAGWRCPGGGAPSEPCPSGTYSPSPGSISCTVCVSGSISTGIGATSCTVCPAGSYIEASQSSSAPLSCSLCPVNTFSPNPGASSRAFCIPCAKSYFSQPGSTSCSAFTWEKLNPLMAISGRQFGLLAVNATAVVAVGGRDENGLTSSVSLGYDARNGVIIETPLSSNTASLEYSAVASHPTDGSTYFFGGVSSSGIETATLWLLNANTAGAPSVTQIVFPVSPAPSARRLAGMAYLTSCNTVTITGACLVLLGGERAGVLLGDVWVFDLSARVWSQPLGTNINMPSPRSGHSVVAAPNATMLFVFGGMTSSGATNDIFVLSPFGYFDATIDEMTNVAVGKPASMSLMDTRWSQRGPGAANDGQINSRMNQQASQVTSISSAPCSNNCHWCAQSASPISQAVTPNPFLNVVYGATDGTTSPWWGVDLGAITNIDFIHLYVRQPIAATGTQTYDFPFGKNSNSRIYATNDISSPVGSCTDGAATCPYTSVGSACPGGSTLTISAGVNGCPINADVPSDILAGGPTIIQTSGLSSRYLYFVLPGPQRILSICEFQAYQKKPWVWRKLSGIYNAALLKKATQSSTQTSSVYSAVTTGAETGVAKFAVDGLLTNWLTNTAPLTMSVTNGGEPIIIWSVDLGLTVTVQSVRIFGNDEAAFKTNNGNIAFYLGDSADYKWNTKCANGPTNISPNPSTCISGNANTVVTQNGIGPFRACYLEFTCPSRGRFLQVVKSGPATERLYIGELEVYASKLLDEPTPRAFSSTTVYGGSMVIFGGSDSIGFRNNEIRFFDMLRGMWLSSVQALGTSPVARSGAFFMNIPSQTNSPSSKFILFGGLGGTSSDVLNDVSVLSLPSCPEISSYGVQSQSCSPASVCTFTCIAGAIATNPPNEPLVCQLDGSWRGILPPCRFPYPLKPTAVTATVFSTGIASVSWVPPVAQFPYTPLVTYRVKQVPQEIFEDYTLGAFPARIGPVVSAPIGSRYIGGNWWRLIEKNGNVLIPNLNVNSWDFWQGWLRVNSDQRRLNSFDTNDNLVLYRDWPAGIDAAKDWAVETFGKFEKFNLLQTARTNLL